MLRRRLALLATVVAVVLIGLVSGAVYLYFAIYLVAATVGLAYLVARRGLTNLEAGSWLDRHQASVGDVLTVTTALRSTSGLPRTWLEVQRPSTLPMAIPGRVVTLGAHESRTWAARVPLPERGQFRVDALVIRCSDPVGLFESVASVGSGVTLTVHPVVAPLPAWRLPSTSVEGASARSEAGPHMTPLVATVRPYSPGDAFNRIHWRSSARHQELQVKESDIEPSADLWLILDLDRIRHVGVGADSTVETTVRTAAALAGHALLDGRAVGLEAVGLRRTVLPLDQGARQLQKILGLLAVAQADGATSFEELLTQAVSRPRRGTVTIVVTPSLDPTWIRPLASLRGRGAALVACIIDPLAHLTAAARRNVGDLPGSPTREAMERGLRALLHTLDEHDVEAFLIRPERPLGDQLVAGRGSILRTVT